MEAANANGFTYSNGTSHVYGMPMNTTKHSHMNSTVTKSNMTGHCNCTGNMGMAYFNTDANTGRKLVLANMTLHCNNTRVTMNVSTALHCNCTEHKNTGHCNCSGMMGIHGKMFDSKNMTTHKKHHCNCTGHLWVMSKSHHMFANMSVHCFCPNNISMTSSFSHNSTLTNITHRGNATGLLTKANVMCNCTRHSGLSLFDNLYSYCNCTGNMGTHMTNASRNHTHGHAHNASMAPVITNSTIAKNITHRCNCSGNMGMGSLMSIDARYMGVMANMSLHCNSSSNFIVNSSSALMCNCTQHKGIKGGICNCTGEMGLIARPIRTGVQVGDLMANLSSHCNCTGHMRMRAVGVHNTMLTNVTLHCYCPGNRSIMSHMAKNGTTVVHRGNGSALFTNVTSHCICSGHAGSDMYKYCNCTGHMGLHVANTTNTTHHHHHMGQSQGMTFRYEPNTVSILAFNTLRIF